MTTPLTLSPNGHVTFPTAPPRGRNLGPRPSPRTWIQPVLALLLIAALLAAYFTVARHDEPASILPGVATPPAETVAPGDWPMYRGNAARTGAMPGPGITGAPAILWQFAAGAAAPFPPAVAGGVVYLPTDGGTFYALDAATGTITWQQPGGFAMPSASASTLYYVTLDEKLAARDLATGQNRWQAAPGSRYWTPLLDGDTVYYGSDTNLLVARDAQTGEQRWAAAQTTPASRSAALADDILVVGSEDHHVYGVDQATGATRWQAALGDENATIQTPAIADGVAYVGTFDGSENTFLALDLQTGAERWRFAGTAGENFGAAAVADGLVFLPSDSGALRALDAATGEVRWTYTSLTSIASAPMVVDGVVYAGTGSGPTGIIVAVDAATGSERWQLPLDGQVNYGPVLAHGRLYIGTDVGNVYAIGSAGDLPAGATPAVITPSTETPATPEASAAGANASATPTAASLTAEWMLTREDGEFAGAISALEIDPFGRLWTCNLDDGSIQIFDRDGNQLAKVAGGLGSGPDQWNWYTSAPQGGYFEGCGIAFAPDGTTYITDGGNNRIKVLDPNGKLLETWSTANKEDPRLYGPVAIARLHDGSFLVMDWGKTDTTRRFSADGVLQGDFDPGPTFDAATFDAISAQEDAAGNLWFVELTQNRVVKFAPDGTVLLTIGGPAPGTGPGQFNGPTDLALDEAGNIYVADNANQRLQVFAPDGTFLAQFTGEEAGIPRFGSEGGAIASVASGGNGYLYVTDYARDDPVDGDQRLIKFRITLPGEP